MHVYCALCLWYRYFDVGQMASLNLAYYCCFFFFPCAAVFVWACTLYCVTLHKGSSPMMCGDTIKLNRYKVCPGAMWLEPIEEV